MIFRNSFPGQGKEELFQHPFWLDTYYNSMTGKFHFAKSDDELDRFNFLVPMTPDEHGQYKVKLINSFMI